MPVYIHLDHAFDIIRKQPNYKLWGPMIDALPQEVQEEIRPWLQQQARLIQWRVKKGLVTKDSTSRH